MLDEQQPMRKKLLEGIYTVSFISSPSRSAESRRSEVAEPPDSEAALDAAASPRVLRFRFLAAPPATRVPTPGVSAPEHHSFFGTHALTKRQRDPPNVVEALGVCVQDGPS